MLLRGSTDPDLCYLYCLGEYVFSSFSNEHGTGLLLCPSKPETLVLATY